MIEVVTNGRVQHYLDLYAASRGGLENQDTNSEAAFILHGPYCGANMITVGREIMWTGLQNASARISNDGNPWGSIEDAIKFAMTARIPRLVHSMVWYSDNAVERFRWLADRVEEAYASGDFLLYSP